MRPLLCDTCLNCEKEIKEIVRGWYGKKAMTLYYFCKKKDKYVVNGKKYKCSNYTNRTLEDYQYVK